MPRGQMAEYSRLFGAAPRPDRQQGLEAGLAEGRAEALLRRRSSSAAAGTGSRPPSISPRSTASATSRCVERGWIGQGNVGRNTTIVRSNYDARREPEVLRVEHEALGGAQPLAQLQRHVLAARRAEPRATRRASSTSMPSAATACGSTASTPSCSMPEEIAKLCPGLDLQRERALPGRRRPAAAARRHRPPRRRRLGLRARRRPARRRHHRELRGDRLPEGGRPRRRRRHQPRHDPRAEGRRRRRRQHVGGDAQGRHREAADRDATCCRPSSPSR